MSRSTMSDRTEKGRAAGDGDEVDASLGARRRESRNWIRLSWLEGLNARPPPLPISGDELSETVVASECQPASSDDNDDEVGPNRAVDANEVPVESDAADDTDDDADGGGAGKPIGSNGGDKGGGGDPSVGDDG